MVELSVMCAAGGENGAAPAVAKFLCATAQEVDTALQTVAPRMPSGRRSDEGRESILSRGIRAIACEIRFRPRM